MSNTNNVVDINRQRVSANNVIMSDFTWWSKGLQLKGDGLRREVLLKDNTVVGTYNEDDNRVTFTKALKVGRFKVTTPPDSFEPVELAAAIWGMSPASVITKAASNEPVPRETTKAEDTPKQEQRKPTAEEIAAFEARQERERIERRARELRIDKAARELLARELREATAGRVGAPVILTGAEFMAQPTEAAKYRVDTLWNEGGQVLLYAAAKAGKSTFMHNLVESLTNGRAFLDMYDVERVQGRVTLIDFELSPDRLREELAHYDLDHDRFNIVPMRHMGAGQFDPMDDANRAQWAAMLREANTEVLIIDCLGPVVRATGRDPNTEGGHMLDAIILLCAEAGIKSHLVVDHASSKSYAGDNGARGDSTKMDIPDHLWHLRKHGDGDNAKFTVDITGRAEDVHLDLVRNGYKFAPAEGVNTLKTPAEVNAGKLRDAFLEAIEDYHAGQLAKGEAEDSPKSWPAPKVVIEAVRGHARAKFNLGRPAVSDALDYLTGNGTFELAPGARANNHVVMPLRNVFVPNKSRRTVIAEEAEKMGVDPAVMESIKRPT